MGEVVDSGLCAMLTVHGAGGGQLRWSVDRASVGHILREATAADVAVLVAADIVVAVGGIL